MVVRKNEYSRAFNASYTFQPLMSFWISFSWVSFTLLAKEKGYQLPLPHALDYDSYIREVPKFRSRIIEPAKYTSAREHRLSRGR